MPLVPADPDFSELRTERLVIRRFRQEDATTFAAYRSDPNVARYQSWDNYTLADAHGFMQEMAPLHPGEAGEWFQFATADAVTDELLGDVALCVDVNDVGRAELGFTFAPAYQPARAFGFAPRGRWRSTSKPTGCIAVTGRILVCWSADYRLRSSVEPIQTE